MNPAATSEKIDIPVFRRIFGYDLSFIAVLAGPVGLSVIFAPDGERLNVVGLGMILAAGFAVWRNWRLRITSDESHIQVRRLRTKRIAWREIDAIGVVATGDGRKACQLYLADGTCYRLPVESWFHSTPTKLADRLGELSPAHLGEVLRRP